MQNMGSCCNCRRPLKRLFNPYNAILMVFALSVITIKVYTLIYRQQTNTFSLQVFELGIII